MLVRADVLRGRFRNSYETPEPFESNQATNVRFELQDVLHTFKRGHRLMVHVQSTWFPFVDRNPQSWVPNIFEATEEDFVKATHRVYRGEHYPSGIRVGVLSP
jgi:predicted acyl esterase